MSSNIAGDFSVFAMLLLFGFSAICALAHDNRVDMKVVVVGHNLIRVLGLAAAIWGGLMLLNILPGKGCSAHGLVSPAVLMILVTENIVRVLR